MSARSSLLLSTWILLASACATRDDDPPEDSDASEDTDTDPPDDTDPADTDTEGPVDADEDGFDETVDCDDDDDRVYPGAPERCDGLDNDCDPSTVEGPLVPTTWPTLQAAVDALPDGSEICVEPGTWTEHLDLSGRTLTLTGQRGPDQTFLDVGTAAPMLTLAAEGEGADAGQLTLRGFTVTGGELGATEGDLLGGFARVVQGTLVLEDLEVTDLTGSLTGEHDLEGLLVWADRGDVTLRDVAVDGLTLTFRGEAEGDGAVRGGLVRTVDGTLTVETLSVTDLELTAAEGRPTCIAVGALITAADGTLSQSGSVSIGTDYDLRDVSLVDSRIDLTCTDLVRAGSLLYLEDEPGLVDGLEIARVEVMLSTGGATYANPLVQAWFPQDRGAVFRGLTLTDNTLSATASSRANASGLFDVEGGGLSHATLWNNTLTAQSQGIQAGCGPLIGIENGSLDHVDVRGNQSTCAKTASDLIDIEGIDADLEISHLVLAGNRVEAPTLLGGALYAWVEGGAGVLRQADIVGNHFVGEASSSPALLTLATDDTGDSLAVSGLQVVDNTVDGTGSWAALDACLESCDGMSVSWSNLHGQDAQTLSGDVSGTDGNLDVDPSYTDVTGDDATTWDLTLGTGSPAVDAGDPAVLDDDGSRADMGAYGGPWGSW